MASRAVLRRGLIEEHSLGADRFRQLMAVATLHVLMRAAQWKSGPLLVIEKRRLPLHTVVAIGAGSGFSLGKLLSVDVFVAILAKHGSSFEIHVK